MRHKITSTVCQPCYVKITLPLILLTIQPGHILSCRTGGWNNTTNSSTLGYFACLTGTVNRDIFGLKTLSPINNYELAVDDVYFSVMADSTIINANETIHQDAQVSIIGNDIQLNQGEGIQLYSVTGALVAKTESDILNIKFIPAGFYIIKTPYGVTKFMKK